MVRRGVEGDLGKVLVLEREAETAPHWGLGEYEGLVGEAGEGGAAMPVCSGRGRGACGVCGGEGGGGAPPCVWGD